MGVLEKNMYKENKKNTHKFNMETLKSKKNKTHFV